MNSRFPRDLHAPGEREDALADLEALLFAAPRAISLAEIARRLFVDEAAAAGLITAMQSELGRPGRGLRLRETAGRWQLATHPDREDIVAALRGERGERPVSPQALETLVVVALRQPVTADEITRTRGTESHGPLQTLARRGLIAPVEHSGQQGRAARWRTTRLFLDRFGLGSLAELQQDGRVETILGRDPDQDDAIEPLAREA